MAKFVIEITCDNAAFHDAHGNLSPEPELAYILTGFVGKPLADGIMWREGRTVVLRDSNGNKVGSARLIETE